jgi:hypothetical protein
MIQSVERLFLVPISLGIAAIGLAACSDPSTTSEVAAVQAISRADLEAAASKRVVFAHQSVGNDILDGVRALAGREGVSFNIVETRSAPATGGGIFHFKVGENGAPERKLQDYMRTFEQAGGAGADIALVKLCYIDFSPDTDPVKLASDYIDTVKALQGRYSQTRFVAVTAPLTTVQTGPKAMIKKLLGRSPGGYAENAVRQQFNDELRRQFPAGSLFDLAKLEADAGGSEHSVEVDGRRVQALQPAITSDGGHLNDNGKLLVASSFVEFLSKAPAVP